jgi:hypothetical protein
MSLLLNNPAHWHLRAQEARLFLGTRKLTLLSSRSRMNMTILQSAQQSGSIRRSRPVHRSR